MFNPQIKLSITSRLFFIFAALLGATGVALGAYASHGLSARAGIEQVEYFQLAVTYQLIHALTLFAVCILSLFIRSYFLLAGKIAFVSGVLLFSGSLYLYVLTGTKIIAMLTPIGGLLLIIGWTLVALSLLTYRNS